MLRRHIGNADSRTAYYQMSAGVGNAGRIVSPSRRRTTRSFGRGGFRGSDIENLVSHSVTYS
jgi:hypothetical protein